MPSGVSLTLRRRCAPGSGSPSPPLRERWVGASNEAGVTGEGSLPCASSLCCEVAACRGIFRKPGILRPELAGLPVWLSFFPAGVYSKFSF